MEHAYDIPLYVLSMPYLLIIFYRFHADISGTKPNLTHYIYHLQRLSKIPLPKKDILVKKCPFLKII